MRCEKVATMVAINSPGARNGVQLVHGRPQSMMTKPATNGCCNGGASLAGAPMFQVAQNSDASRSAAAGATHSIAIRS